MKTTLQELLEWINSAEGRAMEDAWWEIQVKIQELIPKEKEIIENAYNSGENDENLDLHRKSRGYKDCKDYYNKTYNNGE